MLEELGEPVVSYISAHEVIEVESKKVSVRYVAQWIAGHWMLCETISVSIVSTAVSCARVDGGWLFLFKRKHRM